MPLSQSRNPKRLSMPWVPPVSLMPPEDRGDRTSGVVWQGPRHNHRTLGGQLEENYPGSE